MKLYAATSNLEDLSTYIGKNLWVWIHADEVYYEEGSGVLTNILYGYDNYWFMPIAVHDILGNRVFEGYCDRDYYGGYKDNTVNYIDQATFDHLFDYTHFIYDGDYKILSPLEVVTTDDLFIVKDK